MSQLGPAWMTLTLRCDCTYASGVQLAWSRMREEGYYRVVRGAVQFTRPSSETSWPYRFHGPELALQEEETEVHRYKRSRSFTCL